MAYGPLLPDSGAAWLGTAMLIKAPDPDKARGWPACAGHPSVAYAQGLAPMRSIRRPWVIPMPDSTCQKVVYLTG